MEVDVQLDASEGLSQVPTDTKLCVCCGGKYVTPADNKKNNGCVMTPM
jgi:hypothetical protein